MDGVANNYIELLRLQEEQKIDYYNDIAPKCPLCGRKLCCIRDNGVVIYNYITDNRLIYICKKCSYKEYVGKKSPVRIEFLPSNLEYFKSLLIIKHCAKVFLWDENENLLDKEVWNTKIYSERANLYAAIQRTKYFKNAIDGNILNGGIVRKIQFVIEGY